MNGVLLGWTGQYDDKYTEKDMMKGWFNLMSKLSNKWNLFALDLKNEPFGTATWVSSGATMMMIMMTPCSGCLCA